MNIISSKVFTKSYINELFALTEDIEENPEKYSNLLHRKILINAFFEPSTRTSLSFESAMKQLGGEVITFNKETSSLQKGETFEDTIRSLECYGDIMVLRHPGKEQINIASKILKIPIINGGNGNGEHPTQALLDLYTIYKSFDDMDNKKILFIGDIKNSRTIHSLIELLQLYPKTQINLWSYKNCNEEIQNNKREVLEIENIDVGLFDVIYCTRFQKERVDNPEHNDEVIITPNLVKKMKKNSIIMHPLPRNNEIDPEVDNDDRSKYFEQMRNGVNIRKAILLELLNKNK